MLRSTVRESVGRPVILPVWAGALEPLMLGSVDGPLAVVGPFPVAVMDVVPGPSGDVVDDVLGSSAGLVGGVGVFLPPLLVVVFPPPPVFVAVVGVWGFLWADTAAEKTERAWKADRRSERFRENDRGSMAARDVCGALLCRARRGRRIRRVEGERWTRIKREREGGEEKAKNG